MLTIQDSKDITQMYSKASLPLYLQITALPVFLSLWHRYLREDDSTLDFVF